jgi:hypothetical protein
MDEFLKMDIFFFVATFGILILSILVSLVLYYVVRIVKNVHEISEVVKKETHDTMQDFRVLRKEVREGVHTAKEYTKAFAGANILRGITNIVHAFTENTATTPKRPPAKKRKTKKESTD